MPRKKKVEIVEEEEPKGIRNEFYDESAVVSPVPALTREKVIPPVAPVKPAVVIPPEAENPYYIKTLWHGIKEVWQCKTCGAFRGTEDAMIVHVVIHVPRLEQNALLDKLMEGYKKP